ncbi:MAG: DeoR/GlpR family DNA-binding transcription regulator [Sphaerochaeta sp.]|nr:DeoR/GlpR family DNA-binding transcription regulator [Sphaerochaeta sp.]
MGKKQSRKELILHQLSTMGQVHVTSLSELCNVSQVTIRTDLENLEKQGLLQRIHGGAVQNRRDDIANRLVFDHANKERIADLAASLVNDGETIMIESGSTCTLLAQALGKSKHDVTIITNSVFIARYVREQPTLHVILIGGEYQAESEACVGPLARLGLSQYYTEKCFFGFDGFDARIGFTGSNQSRAEIVEVMKNQCAKMIALSPSGKFSQRGLVKLVSPNEVSIVVTDEQLGEKEKQMILGFGMQVLQSQAILEVTN